MFSLQMSLTDLEETTPFLKYQLIHSFKNNAQEYVDFLEVICTKYKKEIGTEVLLLVTRYITTLKTQVSKEIKQAEIEVIDKGNESVSKDKQILAIKCLLEIVYELSENDINAIPKTKLSKFIQFVTQIETGSKKINGTNLYDTVRELNTLPSKTKQVAQSEWELIRDEFEKINLDVAVKRVDEILIEIKSRKK